MLVACEGAGYDATMTATVDTTAQFFKLDQMYWERALSMRNCVQGLEHVLSP
jgi:hypothetical protein